MPYYTDYPACDAIVDNSEINDVTDAPKNVCQRYGQWGRECDEERKRTHSEDSFDDGDTREEEWRTTENEVEGRVSEAYAHRRTTSAMEDEQGEMGREDNEP